MSQDRSTFSFTDHGRDLATTFLFTLSFISGLAIALFAVGLGVGIFNGRMVADLAFTPVCAAFILSWRMMFTPWTNWRRPAALLVLALTTLVIFGVATVRSKTTSSDPWTESLKHLPAKGWIEMIAVTLGPFCLQVIFPAAGLGARWLQKQDPGYIPGPPSGMPED